MSNWSPLSLGKCIELLTGYPFRSELYTEGDNSIRLLRGDNIIQGRTRWQDAKKWNCDLLDGLDNYFLQKNDVVIAMDRTWVKAGLKVAIIEDGDLPCLLVQRVARLRANKHLAQEYLPYLVSSYKFEQYVKGVQTETAVPHISAEQIKEFPILLPPIHEQRRIAEILATWDEAIALTEKAIEARRRRKNFLIQTFFNPSFSDEEYEILPLEKIAVVERGKFTARPRNDPRYFGGSIPFVQTGDVVASNGFITSYSQTLNEAGLEVSRLFPKGSILVTIAANIGDVAIAEIDVACPDSIVVVQAKTGVCREWLKYALSAKKDDLDALATQNAQKNINLQVLRPLLIHVPSKDKQEKIAKVLLDCDKEIAQIIRLLELYRKQKQGLMQKLLIGEWRVAVQEAA